MHPGDARRYPLHLRIVADEEELGTNVTIAVSDSGDTTSRPDRWYIRGGRVTRADTSGVETLDAGLADLRPEAVAVLSPWMAETWTNSGGWEVTTEVPRSSTVMDESGVSSRPAEMRRTVFDERLGDLTETVRYRSANIDGIGSPWTAEFELGGSTIARFVFGAGITSPSLPGTPPPGPQRIDIENRNTLHQLAPEQVHFTALAPHLFTIDLDSLNTRVTVAEFSDSLAVIEGAFGSGVCDVLARAVEERFHKPVRVFAFSHLHGQYSGGTRSWVHEGATVVVPPSTEPLIHQMVDASFKSHPDALAREPRPLRLRTVAQRLHLEDATNALDIYNVPSGHTDEYLLFHFPRQRVLLTGDLMFYRPGKPFAGRSKQLSQTVAKLGLAVDTYVASWPLAGFGTRNIVTAAEFAQAAADTAGGRAAQ